MTCVVAGFRQYSSDLPQGRLEVPCKLTLSAPTKDIQKLCNLLSADQSHYSVNSSASLNHSLCSPASSTADPASSTSTINAHDTVSGDVDPVLNCSIVINIAADEVSKKLDVEDSAAESPPQ